MSTPRNGLHTRTGLVLAAVLLMSSHPGEAQEVSRQSSRETAEDRGYIDRSHNEALADRVWRRLAASGSLSGSNIDVTAERGVVTIDGVVGREQDKERATRIAARVRGVTEVRNGLNIDPAVDRRRQARVPDDQLSKNIADKLMREFFPRARVERDWLYGWEVEGDSWEFEVDVDDGDVTLSGEVPPTQRISEIIRSARLVHGVRSLESRLRLDYDGTPWDAYPYSPWFSYPID